MTEKILILDFGSQYTQLIARAVREANVYCEIIPYHKKISFDPSLKGIILSGSPFSVNEENAPDVNVQEFITKVPVLGVCYGAQLTAKRFGGRVDKSNKREYGRAILTKTKDDRLLKNVSQQSQVWMSHADTILELPKGFELLATTESIPIAAFKKSEVLSRESGVSLMKHSNGTPNSELTTHDSRLTTHDLPTGQAGSRLTTHDFPLYCVQ
ncbi:MAG: glutamine-hydrolyzing GMP synthase, partial [Bacteroidota bacterium]